MPSENSDETEAHFADAMRDINPQRGSLGAMPIQMSLDGSQSESSDSFKTGVDLFLQDFRGCIVGRDSHYIATEMCERVIELVSEGKFSQKQTACRIDNANNFIKASVQLDKMLRFIWEAVESGNPNSIAVKVFSLLYGRDFPEFDAILGNTNQAQFARTIIQDYIPEIGDDKGKRLKMEARHAMSVWTAYARKRCRAKPLTKAAVNNSVLDTQKYFGWPARNDQRKEKSRENMSATRIKQLKTI